MKSQKYIETGTCEMRNISKNKKHPHFVSDRPQLSTTLRRVYADASGKQRVSSHEEVSLICTECRSRMERSVLVRREGEAPQMPQRIIKEVPDPEVIHIENIGCDEDGEFEGRSQALAEYFGITIETRPPYIPIVKAMPSPRVVFVPYTELFSSVSRELLVIVTSCEGRC